LQSVMDLSLVVMKELLAAQRIERELTEDKKIALTMFQQPKQRSLALPSIEGLNERLKSFVQKIEHATQAINSFTKQFYGHTEKMSKGFELEVQKLYGDSDEFSKFAGSILPFMNFVRNLRNAIEHPKDNQRTIINDFAITPDGTMTSPTLQLVHVVTPQPEMDVESFLSQVSSHILEIFEVLMVHLASKHIQKFGGFEKTVGLLSTDQHMPGSKVRASYFIWFDDRWTKLG
jgi:hypothetical protein